MSLASKMPRMRYQITLLLQVFICKFTHGCVHSEE